jgi:hypothetical protein
VNLPVGLKDHPEQLPAGQLVFHHKDLHPGSLRLRLAGAGRKSLYRRSLNISTIRFP